MKAKTLQVPHMEVAPHIANHHEGILPEKKHLVVCFDQFDQYWQATITAALLLHIVDHCNVTRHFWHLLENMRLLHVLGCLIVHRKGTVTRKDLHMPLFKTLKTQFGKMLWRSLKGMLWLEPAKQAKTSTHKLFKCDGGKCLGSTRGNILLRILSRKHF